MIDVVKAPPSEWTHVFENVYSQFGEDGVLKEIFRRIGTTNKQCFEVGAADGKWFSNSRRLIDGGWSAALIESDEKNWAELDKLDNPPRINVVHGKAEPSGPSSLDSILGQCGFVADMDLGVIDVDGQDYYLWNGMLKFRPRVMVVEYDRFADNAFVPDLNGLGQAGVDALCSIAVSKGYLNVARTETNAIFVLNSEREKFYAPESKSTPSLATGKEQEIKIAAILSRPRFGLNVFFDCAAEALNPWHIPIQSFYGVFWNQCMERGIEDNIAAGMDWILTLDYDSMITSRHIQLLIDCLAQNPQIDAVAPLQCRRGRPLPLAVRADGSMPLTGGPVQVRTAHFGCTLFRCDAFRKMTKKPWFGEVPAKDGSWGEGRLDPDIAFWGRWGDAGNTLFVHTGCRIGHVEEVVSEFDENGKHQHVYISEWRKRNGHTIKNFE